MNNNSVAYIAKIESISPIEGADKIELAHVKGWTSIVQKSQHTVGDLVLCIVTDAVIPQELVDKWNVGQYLRKGNRVRTIKLRGVYSDCILISLDKIRPELYNGLVNPEMDMMETLNIFKYEPPEIIISTPGQRKVRYHQNPNFAVYHKFANFKNVPKLFNTQDTIVVTRKIHGTNARYGIVKKSKLSVWDKIRRFFGNDWIEYEYVYGSHNVEKGSDSQGFYSTDVWKEIADKYDIKRTLWNFVKSNYLPRDIGSGFILYGEIYGPGIQGDKYTYGLKERSIKFFDIQQDGEYQQFESAKSLIGMMRLSIIEVLGILKFDYDKIFDNFVKDNFIEGTKIPHEGVVIRSLNSPSRDKICKIINPDYLIHAERYNVPDSH